MTINSHWIPNRAAADDAFENDTSWKQPDADGVTQMLTASLTSLGVSKSAIDQAVEQMVLAIKTSDADLLDSFIAASRSHSPILEKLATLTTEDLQEAGRRLDPPPPAHLPLKELPDELQATAGTWLGRELVRARLYDEGLPALVAVDATQSVDPAATLFFRGVCYHALLKKNEALVDLNRLLENEKDCPVRFTRTTQLMVADISPLRGFTRRDIAFDDRCHSETRFGQG